MAFEGEHKIIPVKGIARAGADSLCEDGAMNEVIGLEYKDGSYVPYKEGARQYLFPLDAQEKASFFRVHKTSSGNNIIAGFKDYHGVKGLHWISEDSFNSGRGQKGENWTVLYGGDVKDVEFIGNVICISDNNSFKHYISQETGYKYFTVDKDKLPDVAFRVTNGLSKKDALGILKYTHYDTQPTSAVKETATSELIAARGKAREEGGLTGYLLVCAAYRTKTGEYIKASAPVLMGCPMNKYRDYLYNEGTDGTSIELVNDEGNVITKEYLSIKNVDVLPFFRVNYMTENEFIYLKKVDNKYGFEYSYGNTKLSNTIDVLYKDGDIYKLSENPSNILYYPCMCSSVVISDYDISPEASGVINYFSIVPTNKLQYKINKDIIADENLIDSLCIFISNEIDPYIDFVNDKSADAVLSKSSIADNVNSTYFDYAYAYNAIRRKEQDIIDDIKKVNNLYKAIEINYKDIKKSDDWIGIDLSGILGDNLLVRETLPLSAFDYNIIKSPSIDSYNSRIHIYNYIQELINGYNIYDYNLYGGFGQYSGVLKTIHSAYIIVEVKTENDNARIVKYINTPTITVDVDDDIAQPLLSPLISYHDSSAVNIKIGLKMREDTDYIWTSYSLSKSSVGGLSMFIQDTISYINASFGTIQVDGSQLVSYNNIINKNLLRMSDTYLPNYFPNANTYTIGNGTIIGLASLSIALSQDTFGSYPLLVFTTDGIYSMEIDKTGVGVYTNVPPPFSREVCINKNTICEIDGAVLFASSKGLMIASAQGVQEFLPTLNGKPRHLPAVDKDTNGLGLKLYRDAINNFFSTELLSGISHDDFIQFLSDADTVVSYVSNKNKVIVYNKNHEYSYWIDIPTRIVTKLPIGIAFDNDNYPTEQYVLNTGEVFEFGYLSTTNFDVQCLLQSRPIKNTYGMKSNLRVIARGYFNSSDADNYAVMLVLGSYDAINWQPIGICQRPFAGGFNDLGCVTDRVSCKYVMVIITGKMSADSHIDGIEMTINNKYNNKLK